MSSFNFADKYKAAGLAPGNEIIRLRQDPFESLRADADFSIILDLSRLYFGLPVSPETKNWFRDAFAETDASFTLIDNQREIALLAVCLLSAVLADGNAQAAFIPLITAAGGNRVPVLCPEYLEEAKQYLAIHAVAERARNKVEISKIKLPAKTKAAATIDAVVANPAWPPLGEAIKAMGNESYEATKTLANQVAAVVTPLNLEVRALQEEVSMLWWYIGGWSRALNKPFSELDVAVAALTAGLDLADLVKGEIGPVAAPAILHRLVVAPRSAESEILSLDVAANALPMEAYKNASMAPALNSIMDICPVLCALSKVNEIGLGDGWHFAFKKATGLEATIEFSALELAMQVYRESLLAKLAE